MPRIARVCAVGFPHHITQRGNNRETVFFKDGDRRFYLKTLVAYSRKWDFKIWAYCLMTNHVHVLAAPGEEVSLARGIGATNLVYTQHINRKYRRSGRLWQNRFFSTVVESGAYLWAVARYIELNPVRAGIVKRPEDYEWSNARAHIAGERDDVLSGHGWLDESEQKGYREFLGTADEETEKKIRRATSTGRPLGTVAFIKRLEDLLSRDILPRRAGRPKK